ncbi:MAG TPA: response regulator [Terriglobia bacterium]|nr:response regulator [Terriglobia bacterium]
MTARILIVDDDDTWHSLLVRTLERSGYSAQAECNGAAGLAAYRKDAFDLVITDVFMPEADGLEIISALQNAQPRPKILAMSGSNTGGRLDFVAVVADLGADLALRKPFGPDILLASVKALLG